MSGVPYDDAERLALASLWWRLAPPTLECTRRVLHLFGMSRMREMAVPPLGLLADLLEMGGGTPAVFRPDRPNARPPARPRDASATEVPGWNPRRQSAYREEILGRIAADTRVDAALRAVWLYPEHDLDDALIFLINQLSRCSGWELPTVSSQRLRVWSAQPVSALWQQSWRAALDRSVAEQLAKLYREGDRAFRRCRELLTAADLFEIEQGTAAIRSDQKLALRQVFEVLGQLDLSPTRQDRLPASRDEFLPTAIAAEGDFPAGGYHSLTTRGPIENLLHAQLAYMEDVAPPDLFDLKFLNNELLYYSRDDNVFTRRHHRLVWRLHDDLVRARVPRAGQAAQPIICLLALIVACTRRLADHLGRDGLLVEIHSERRSSGRVALSDELELLERLLRDEVATGQVTITVPEHSKRAPGSSTVTSRAAGTPDSTDASLTCGVVMVTDVIAIAHADSVWDPVDQTREAGGVFDRAPRRLVIGGACLKYAAASATTATGTGTDAAAQGPPVWLEFPGTPAGWDGLGTQLVSDVLQNAGRTVRRQQIRDAP